MELGGDQVAPAAEPVGDAGPGPDGEEATFGSELRRRRRTAGLSLAKLAKELGTNKGYLSRLENGHQRPSEPFALACDDQLGAGGTLFALAAKPISGRCPYPGLTSFGTEDARWFFGRDRAVADLLGLLADASTTGYPAVLIGSSGIGKSSLLRAGLAVAVARGALPARLPGIPATLYLTPTSDPLQVLRGLQARRSLESYALVIVDQFEELFTLCGSQDQREVFIEELCRKATDGLPVVLGVRADFYGHCLTHPVLLSALRKRALPLGPMTVPELRQAITEPAAAEGLTLEPGLVEVLLRDLGAAPDADWCAAGALPLLSHTLRATWQHRNDDGVLTVTGYQRTGGVHGAIAATAARVYDELTSEQQRAVRPMMLSMVRVGDHEDDVRRPADRADLIETDPCADAVVEAFTRARLLTTSTTSVEISHEALLRAWPDLSAWISEDRAALRAQQQLQETARAWIQEDQDPHLLYQGVRLAAARDLAVRHVLGAREEAFVRASMAHQEAQARAERARVRRLRALTAALAALALLVTGAAGFAWEQKAAAQRERQLTIAGLLSGESARLARTRPDVSALLAAAAYRQRRTPQTRGALLSTQAQGFIGRLPPHPGALWSTSISDDGRILATSDNIGQAATWDVHRRKRLWTVTDRSKRLQAIAVSPDGSLVAGADHKQLWLWQAHSGALLASTTLRHGVALGALEFSADGTTLAMSGTGVQLLRVQGLEAVPSPAWTNAMPGLALHPQGTMVAGAGKDGTVRLWRLPSATSPGDRTESMPPILKAGNGPLYDVAFSPDGALLAAAGRDRVVHLWRTSDWRPAGSLNHSDEIWRLAFRADGQVLATAGEDQRVLLWNVPTRRLLTALAGHSASVHTVAFPRTGHQLVSGASDHSVALWDTGGWHGDGCTGKTVRATAYSPGGPAVTAGDNTIHYRIGDRCRHLRMDGPVHGLARGGPGGHLLAAGGNNGQFRLWDLRHPEKRHDRTLILANTVGPQQGIAISLDGTLAAAGGYDNHIRTWTITPSGLADQTIQTASSTVRALAFSPDNQTLAIGADRNVELSPRNHTGPPQRLTALSAPVTALTYNATGDTLAIGAEDGSVALWDIRTRTRTFTLASQQGPVRALLFDPSGNWLAIVGVSGAARWWTLSQPWALDHACQAHSFPGSQEWNRLLPDVRRSDIAESFPC
ncbi:helix-turn-helix domain-containing protein [Actinomadura sp. 6N118]|uniref:nSTAND1 domain-containing NTPase n=1 Tax=Actinomadura sp. 6N118 TaxID=3375151 RepID=UPI0037924769